VFDNYYERLIHLDVKALCPQLVAAKIISHEDSHIVHHAVEPSKAASHVLRKIYISFRMGVYDTFDEFLSILEKHDDLTCNILADQMRKDLLKSKTGTA